MELSKWFFNKLADLNHGPESILSGGNFWSAKIAFQVGNAVEINKYLRKAAKFERTFYSTLAKGMLGYQDDFDFQLRPVSKPFLKKIKSFKGGKRILALLQVSQFYKASREFRKIIFNFKTSE